MWDLSSLVPKRVVAGLPKAVAPKLTTADRRAMDPIGKDQHPGPWTTTSSSMYRNSKACIVRFIIENSGKVFTLSQAKELAKQWMIDHFIDVRTPLDNGGSGGWSILDYDILKTALMAEVKKEDFSLNWKWARGFLLLD